MRNARFVSNKDRNFFVNPNSVAKFLHLVV